MHIKPTISRTGVYGLALQGKKILLIKQQKGPHAGKFDFPGGGIEPGETIEEALRREFCEEVALTFTSFQLFDNLTAITEEPTRFFHQIGLIYKVQHLSPLLNQTPEMESYWVDLDDLHKQPISPFVRQVLEKKFTAEPQRSQRAAEITA